MPIDVVLNAESLSALDVTETSRANAARIGDALAADVAVAASVDAAAPLVLDVSRIAATLVVVEPYAREFVVASHAANTKHRRTSKPSSSAEPVLDELDAEVVDDMCFDDAIEPTMWSHNHVVRRRNAAGSSPLPPRTAAC